jgi:hypothetical protein
MMTSKLPINEIIKTKVKKDKNGCWNWTGNGTNSGYGQIGVGNCGTKRAMAHRFFFEKMVGKIDDGMQIDHLCRNRRCVNPKHLRQCTVRENVLSGNGFSAQNARKTHCVNNHELSGSNIMIIKTGVGNQRRCKKCIRVWSKMRGRERQSIIKLLEKFFNDYLSLRNLNAETIKKNFY